MIRSIKTSEPTHKRYLTASQTKSSSKRGNKKRKLHLIFKMGIETAAMTGMTMK
jgi:hypothetical protein